MALPHTDLSHDNPFYWFMQVMTRYTTFKGRACRKEYWMFMLSYMIISVTLSFADAVLGLWHILPDIALLSTLFGLSVILPTLAVTVRRLHDTDRSGWWALVLFSLWGAAGIWSFFVTDNTPLLIGLTGAYLFFSLAIFFMMCLKGTPGANRFGEDPKANA